MLVYFPQMRARELVFVVVFLEYVFLDLFSAVFKILHFNKLPGYKRRFPSQEPFHKNLNPLHCPGQAKLLLRPASGTLILFKSQGILALTSVDLSKNFAIFSLNFHLLSTYLISSSHIKSFIVIKIC